MLLDYYTLKKGILNQITTQELDQPLTPRTLIKILDQLALEELKEQELLDKPSEVFKSLKNY